jgi:hypothetical protein
MDMAPHPARLRYRQPDGAPFLRFALHNEVREQAGESCVLKDHQSAGVTLALRIFPMAW